MRQRIKIIFLFAAMELSFSFDTRTDCNLLPNGLYKFEYTTYPNEKPSIIKIDEKKFLLYGENRDTTRGKIEWTYDCSFILNYENKLADTSDLAKLLFKSFGRHLIELNKASGDTIFFRTTYTANLHITVNHGRFIKLK
jgi:hypothetical protein